MKFQFNDGGRSAAGYKGSAGDCVTRAITIASGKPYQEVYDALFSGIRNFKTGRSRAAKRAAGKSGNRGTTPRNGVTRKVYEAFLVSLGFKWVPCMQIGQGCKVHLREDELPRGSLVVAVSKHLTAVVDGMILDTHDCSREGTRCVYGYYFKP